MILALICFIAGFFFGVAMMCIIQVGREETQTFKEGKEP
jgi:hypothetical protein